MGLTITVFINGPFPSSFFLFFVFSTLNSGYVNYIMFPITRFEPWTSGIERDHFEN